MSIGRIIDANANRAGEAVRVMEEAARFILDDEELTRACKRLRHDLAAALAPLAAGVADRDVAGDVGTRLTTPSEMTRRSAVDVVRAAGHRLAEALRVLEEYSKTIDASAAAGLERLRYAAYDLAQRLDRALVAGAARQWTVCVLLTDRLCGQRSWADVAEATIEAGVDCIQLREKELSDAELLERARVLVKMARGTTVIVNDRPDVAVLAGAHGVHLGQDDLPCSAVRRIVGCEMIVGVSTSCLEEARQAKRDGADYCGVGPMFPTDTKQKERIAGPSVLRAYLAWNGLPHLAIGGIGPQNVGVLAEAGCRGVASSAAVCQARDPAAVVRALKTALAPRVAAT